MMVSRRTFFTITVIMLVVLFLFQVPEVMKDELNRLDVNTFEAKTETGLSADDACVVTKKEALKAGRYIVYIGDTSDGGVGRTVSQWCAYSKRYVQAYPSVAAFRKKEDARPQAVLIDAAYFDAARDCRGLSELTAQGVDLIFCTMPDVLQIKKNDALRELLGIRAVLSDNIRVDGLHLFSGLLLGGEKIYSLDGTMKKSQQDLQLELPWYQVAAGTKVYISGMLSLEQKNEDLPAVIWRAASGNAHVFAVNGDYLKDNAGCGFLEGMLYELNDYALYPVVNAKNLVVFNFPSFASENGEEMMARYSQSQEAVYRDIVWPGLLSMSQKCGLSLTCMLAPQMDYQDEKKPDGELLVYYMKLLQEQQAEAGVSGNYKKADSLSDKLADDAAFYHKTMPDYTFLSAYFGNGRADGKKDALTHGLLADVRTLCEDYNAAEPVIGWASENVTTQLITNDGYSHTFSEDLRMNSLETALGYTGIGVDISVIGYPKTKQDTWEKRFEQFAGNTDTYWKAYEAFDATTLSQSDARIRSFLTLGYTQRRKADTVKLSLSDFTGEAWFLLRTHGERPAETDGCSVVQLERDAWLVRVDRQEAAITLENENKLFFTDEG